MRSLLAALVVVLLLVQSASAKGPTAAEICGASGCRSVDDRQIRDSPLADAEQISPPRAGPFFTVRFLLGGERVMGRQTFNRFEASYLPSARAVRTTDERGEPVWRRVKPRVARAYRKVTWNLRPRPASRMGQIDDPLPVNVNGIRCPACPPKAEGGRSTAPISTLVAGAAALTVALGAGLALRHRRALPL